MKVDASAATELMLQLASTIEQTSLVKVIYYVDVNTIAHFLGFCRPGRVQGHKSGAADTYVKIPTMA